MKYWRVKVAMTILLPIFLLSSCDQFLNIFGLINNAPTITINEGNVEIGYDESYTFTVVASDPDQDFLTSELVEFVSIV